MDKSPFRAPPCLPLLTRRRALTRVVTATGALALLAACGGNVTSSTAVGTSSSAVGAAPASTATTTPAVTSTTTASNSSTAATSTSALATSTSALATSTAAASAPANKANAVVFWSNAGYPYKDHVGATLVTQFEQQGGPTIAYTDTLYGDFMQKLLTTVAAGTPPDLSYIDRYVTQAYACRGVLQSMDPMIARSKVITKDMFFPRLVRDTNYHGKTYAIPSGADVGLLYYNKDLFQAAGLDPEQPPTTWDDASSMAQKLTKQQGSTLQQVGWSPSSDWGVPWLVAYWQQGGHQTNSDATKITLSNAQAVNALNYFKKVYDLEGGYDAVSKYVSALGDPRLKGFFASKIAMRWDTHSTIADMATKKVSFRWGASYFPLPPNGQRANYMGGWSLVIPTGAKQAAGAFQYLEFLSQPGPQVAWTEEWNTLPSVTAVANSAAYLKNDPLRKLAVQDAGIAQWVIVAPGSDQTLGVEVGIQKPVLSGQQTPEAELATDQQKLQSILDQAYAHCSVK